MARKRRYLVDVASHDAVEEFAAGLIAAFLECRRLRHSWKAWTAVNHGRYYESAVRCPRCKTRRIETISATNGEILTSRMEYPDGYLAKGIGRIVGDGLGVIRLESIRRTIQAQDEHSAASRLRVVS